MLLRDSIKKKFSGDSKEEPPVPMPNTEVKLFNADDTWWVTAWESGKLLKHMARWSRG